MYIIQKRRIHFGPWTDAANVRVRDNQYPEDVFGEWLDNNREPNHDYRLVQQIDFEDASI